MRSNSLNRNQIALAFPPGVQHHVQRDDAFFQRTEAVELGLIEGQLGHGINQITFFLADLAAPNDGQ